MLQGLLLLLVQVLLAAAAAGTDAAQGLGAGGSCIQPSAIHKLSLSYSELQ